MNINKRIVLTAQQASTKLGITRQALHYLVKHGRIKPVAWIEGKYKYYDEEEINRYLESKFKR